MTRPDAAPILGELAPDLPGEPIFVPRSPDAREDDGFLLTLVCRAQERGSDLVCLDAETLERIAVADLPHAVPPGFSRLLRAHVGRFDLKTRRARASGPRLPTRSYASHATPSR
jgi:all-trans-8'-apo-beta-carotenal 15,15'-oxygenase